ncbi:hypothetical protein [Streptomyces pseudovenezuelae]|uniref:hypothetical protein n=1 Tax=Streptomyces pseudovenezuelae TaxID=67350 RepID=UPI002E33BCA4|nr:hypothetical protein [Streptomyces pseudovenezuelae]
MYDVPGARRMLILEPGTGTVLGLETTATRDDPRYGIRVGAVLDVQRLAALTPERRSAVPAVPPQSPLSAGDSRTFDC